MQFDITASIVLFKNNETILLKAIESFLNSTLSIKLYLIDNSPSSALETIILDPRVEYIFNNKNLGFGTAHNIALKKSMSEAPYHLILNPDVYFSPDVVPAILEFMNKNEGVGQITPLILYPDDRIQYSGKLLPTPLDLIARRLFSSIHYFIEKNKIYELTSSGYDHIMNVPNHLGCFMLIRTNILSLSGLFDEKIFMYMEDVDLTRRIHQHAQTLYYPEAKIYHYYEKGSQKKLKLLYYHIHSAVTYFNKWGWLWDPERKTFNEKAKKKNLPS